LKKEKKPTQIVYSKHVILTTMGNNQVHSETGTILNTARQLKTCIQLPLMAGKTHRHIVNTSPETIKLETTTEDCEGKISSFILLSMFFGKKSRWQAVNMSVLQKLSTTSSQGQKHKEYEYNLHEKFTFSESHSTQYTIRILACLDYTRVNNLAT